MNIRDAWEAEYPKMPIVPKVHPLLAVCLASKLTGNTFSVPYSLL